MSNRSHNAYVVLGLLTLSQIPLTHSMEGNRFAQLNPYVLAGIGTSWIAIAAGVVKYIDSARVLDAQQAARENDEKLLVELSYTLAQLNKDYAEVLKLTDSYSYTEDIIVKIIEIATKSVTIDTYRESLQEDLKKLIKAQTQIKLIIGNNETPHEATREYAQQVLVLLDKVIARLSSLDQVIAHEANFMQLYSMNRKYTCMYTDELRLYALYEDSESEDYLKELMNSILVRTDHVMRVYPVLDYMAMLMCDMQAINKAISLLRTQSSYQTNLAHQELVHRAEYLVKALQKAHTSIALTEQFARDRVQKEQSTCQQKLADAEQKIKMCSAEKQELEDRIKFLRSENTAQFIENMKLKLDYQARPGYRFKA